MTAGRRDLHRALGGLHAFYVPHIGAASGVGDTGCFGRGQHLTTAEVVDDAEQIAGGQHLDPAGPGGFAPLAGRADQAEVSRRRRHRGGENAGDRAEGAIQGQFSQCRVAGDLLARQHVHRGEDGQRERQVEMAALFRQVGGPQIDQHPSRRQRQPDRRERRSYAVFRLDHGFVGEADQHQRRRAGGDLDLHLDWNGIDAGECECVHAGDDA